MKSYGNAIVAVVAILSVAGLSVAALADDATEEADKKVAYESIELWLSGTTLKPEDVMAPNYVNHLDSQIGHGDAPQQRDLEALKEDLAQFHAAFTDVHVTSKEQVAEGDMVATRVVLSAVHSGSYLGEEPTGKTITFDSVEFTRVENGKIVETWVTWDKYGLFQQIGLVK